MFVIRFGRISGSKPMYAGRDWRPYMTKSGASKFKTRESAQTRINGLKEVWARNPSFDRRLIDGIEIVSA